MNTFIYYTGIGCNNSYKHTDEEFLSIIDNLRTTTTKTKITTVLRSMIRRACKRINNYKTQGVFIKMIW
jgi:hypothetical protein